ncbi:MAG: TraR/DksA family transcriptional regulator [Verrucomicrobiaceae bacterium]|nr:TraR/DksA family transcriptional regulator [Verrucomicrobiaceae bacterium]
MAKKVVKKKVAKKAAKKAPAKKAAKKAPAKKAAKKAPAKKVAKKAPAKKVAKKVAKKAAKKAPAKKAAKKPAKKTSAKEVAAPAKEKVPVKKAAKKLSKAAQKKLDDEAALPPIVVKRKYVRPAVLAKLTVFEKKQKQRLLDLRDQITDSMYGMQQDTIKNAVEGNEAKGSRMHQADAGSDAYDRDVALTLLSKEGNALGEIEEALQRLEMGVYGKCEVSGARIPQPRLEAMPFARLTVECQAAKEKEDSLNDHNHGNAFGFN